MNLNGPALTDPTTQALPGDAELAALFGAGSDDDQPPTGTPPSDETGVRGLIVGPTMSPQ